MYFKKQSEQNALLILIVAMDIEKFFRIQECITYSRVDQTLFRALQLRRSIFHILSDLR